MHFLLVRGYRPDLNETVPDMCACVCGSMVHARCDLSSLCVQRLERRGHKKKRKSKGHLWVNFSLTMFTYNALAQLLKERWLQLAWLGSLEPGRRFPTHPLLPTRPVGLYLEV